MRNFFFEYSFSADFARSKRAIVLVILDRQEPKTGHAENAFFMFPRINSVTLEIYTVGSCNYSSTCCATCQNVSICGTQVHVRTVSLLVHLTLRSASTRVMCVHLVGYDVLWQTACDSREIVNCLDFRSFCHHHRCGYSVG